MPVNANQQPSPEALVAEWNSQVNVGDEVEYLAYPRADVKRYNTSSEAFVLSGHTAVVTLAGKAGCIDIECCAHIGSAKS